MINSDIENALRQFKLKCKKLAAEEIKLKKRNNSNQHNRCSKDFPFAVDHEGNLKKTYLENERKLDQLVQSCLKMSHTYFTETQTCVK